MSPPTALVKRPPRPKVRRVSIALNQPAGAPALTANHAGIRRWLWTVAGLVFLMVVVGGATRLTGSGLSITEWKPIHGVVPPLNDAEWQEEFAKYQQIPQYQQINKDMTLGEFKHIFWWEWAHRILARGVGFLVALPLAFFWLAGRLERGLKPRLVGLLALGARPEQIARIHAPIGLEIGAASPAEIAVAVLGQVIRAFRSRGLEARGEAA